jgi:hypothetical protein
VSLKTKWLYPQGLAEFGRSREFSIFRRLCLDFFK